jgi:hypothetical protein
MPFVSFPITLFFLASLVWLVQLGMALPWYLGTLFILTYLFTWVLIGVIAFSRPALRGQKKKRSLLLLTITLVNISLFLAILASLLF